MARRLQPISIVVIHNLLMAGNRNTNIGIGNTQGKPFAWITIMEIADFDYEDDAFEETKAWMLELAGTEEKPPDPPDCFEEGLTTHILDDDRFKNCLRMTRCSLLLQGAPGVGKTSTVAGMIHRLPQIDASVCVAFKIFRLEDKGVQHKAKQVVATLLLKFCEEYRAFPDCVTKLYEARRKHSITLEEMSSALGVAIRKTEKDCVIFLDALDECGDDDGLDALLEALSCVQVSTGVGLVFTSRHDAIPRELFKRLEKIELHSREEDMKSYVSRRLKSHRSHLRDRDGKQYELYNQAFEAILESSGGL
jgi:Cdc6-like AAA superfamily ATPase